MLLSRDASAALVAEDARYGGVITACQLPRTAADGTAVLGSEDTAPVLATARNFHLTERGLRMIQNTMPGHIFLVNKPVCFVSHHSRVGAGLPVWSKHDAASAIFHFGVALEGEAHSSTEMRTAIFTRETRRVR